MATVTTTVRSMALVPETLREASLDSPTFRGTVQHYTEQVELLDKWLDKRIKATAKLVHDILGLEESINKFISRAVPLDLSELLIDHDYAVPLMEKYTESSISYWGGVITSARHVEKTLLEPLSALRRGDLRAFKDARSHLAATQSTYDSLLARYLSQSKSKEPSSLREDAFQVYEARKAYFAAAFDFCVAVPALRTGLDRALTRMLSDLWRDQAAQHRATMAIMDGLTADMQRIRTWSDAMDGNLGVFRQQLLEARAEIEGNMIRRFKPARELDEYSVSTVPYLTHRPASGDAGESEKQGWLFMRTLQGKPSKNVWIRRWFFIRAGIFGWLTEGYRSGGVEESEKIGVLLCNVRPAFQEERRFCFEVKTKDTTILLQAETQPELTGWLSAFEQAKRAAVASTSASASAQAFLIIPPSAPAPPQEPAYVTKGHDGNTAGTERDSGGLSIGRHRRKDGRISTDEDHHIDRASTLGPGIAAGVRAASIDVTRSEPASAKLKLEQKLDLHRGSRAVSVEKPLGSGGISALISAGQALLGGGEQPRPAVTETKFSSLAPRTLVGTSTPVNLLRAAMLTGNRTEDTPGSSAPDTSPARTPGGHRKTVSLDTESLAEIGKKDAAEAAKQNEAVEYPPSYPLALKIQDEHFKILFPGHTSEVLLLAFRATWSPTDTRELPGRVFVTDRSLCFYACHMGLVFTDTTPLAAIEEVKAAPEKDCDYIFFHLRTADSRITLKTYLEPLRLLQRRLQTLVRNASATPRLTPTELLPRLIEIEQNLAAAADSGDVDDLGSQLDGLHEIVRRREANETVQLRVTAQPPRADPDAKLREAARTFKLPDEPIEYTPPDFPQPAVVTLDLAVPAQALFHTMFGELSPLFLTLYSQRQAHNVEQSPWEPLADTTPPALRRTFAYRVSFVDLLSRPRRADVIDHQTLTHHTAHLLYVVTDSRTPWHLPHRHRFSLLTAYVITHSAPGRCTLRIFSRVAWHSPPRFSRALVDRQAHADLQADARAAAELAASLLRALGTHSHAKKALSLYGAVGGGGGRRALPPPAAAAARPTLRQHSLPAMYAETLVGAAEAAVSTVVVGVMAGVAAAARVCSVHRVLVGVVVVLGVALAVTARAAAVAFFTERRAAAMMEALGVAPGAVMERVVHLADIEAMLGVGNASVFPALAEGACYEKFAEVVGEGWGESARRVGAARQVVGAVRNDLIVAMRFVNRVEREMVRGEWEEWVLREGERCERAREMVQGGWEGRLGEYCGSCWEERGRVAGLVEGA